MPNNQKHNPLLLSDEDKLRLEELAPLFDIQVSQIGDSRYRLDSVNDLAPLNEILPAEVMHTRLLLEICSRAVHWIYFHVGKSCKHSLLKLSDAQIHRVAELYALKRDANPGNNHVQSGTVKR